VIAHSDITFSNGEWRLINPNELKFSLDDYDKIRVGVQDFLNAFNFALSAMHLNFEPISREGQISRSRLLATSETLSYSGARKAYRLLSLDQTFSSKGQQVRNAAFSLCGAISKDTR
jgi:hypothetical protein